MTRLWLLFFLLVGAACNKTSGNLTDQQTGELSNLAASIGETQYSIQNAQTTTAIQSISPRTVTTMSDLIKASCQTTFAQTPQAVGQDATVSISAEGVSCPIAGSKINLSTKRKVDAKTDLLTTIDNTYMVNDVTYRKLNDVTGYSVRGSLTVTNGTDPAAPAIFGGGTIRGTILTNTYADGVGFKITLVVKGVKTDTGGLSKTSTLTYDLDFPEKFSAHLSAEVDTDGTTTNESYSLNNKVIAKDEFAVYMKEFGPGFDLTHTLY